MNKLYTHIFLLITSIGFAQFEIDTINKTVSFFKVYNVELSKKDISKKTNEWFAKTFNDSESVIKLNTEDKIIGKGIFEIIMMSSGVQINSDVYFTINVSFKDGRYRFKLENYTLKFDINTIEIEAYVITGNLENYISNIREAWADKPDDYAKKQVLKRINDPKKARQDYENLVNISKSVFSEVESKSEKLAKELFNYIKKEDEDEGW